MRAVQGHDAGECPAVVAHGWNVDYSARSGALTSTASAWKVRVVDRAGRAVGS